jgi:hypothetical protein
MSTYLRMWEKVKELTTEERDQWLTTIMPPEGRVVDFQGVQVIDVDLAEALNQ